VVDARALGHRPSRHLGRRGRIREDGSARGGTAVASAISDDSDTDGGPLAGVIEQLLDLAHDLESAALEDRAGHRANLDDQTLHVRASEPGTDDLIYTIIRNRPHLNIDFMFLEQNEIVPAEDTLHAVRGVATSRPNFFTVDASEVQIRERRKVAVVGAHG
jgi:hypothetical protein